MDKVKLYRALTRVLVSRIPRDCASDLELLRDYIENSEPVKHERWVDHEKLIGIFGTLCDYMVDNGRCDVFCPYAETKDKDDECEAWKTIQKIRQEVKNETD